MTTLTETVRLLGGQKATAAALGLTSTAYLNRVMRGVNPMPAAWRERLRDALTLRGAECYAAAKEII